MIKNSIQFLSPIDGDMMHARDEAGAAGGSGPKGGIVEEGKRRGEGERGAGVTIAVRLSGPVDGIVRVNGELASGKDGVFSVTVRLTAYKNYIEAEEETSGDRNGIFVYWLPNFAGKYRLSIDDNIWFLRDLQQHIDQYHSLFDNSYLSLLRDVHRTYGTKVHLNLFYQTDGFTLSDMSDRFKSEWQENADWLRLSFHALQEFPDKPYQHAGYAEVKRDCELVKNEIRRFAGEQLMGPMTTLHWGEATVEGSRALRDTGYVAQLGYFNVDDELPAVSYYLNVEERRHMKKRFVWRDNKEGIIFVRSSIVIDKTPLDQIVPYLDQYKQEGRMPPYVDLLVHEQYYYPFYEAYQPDYRDRLMTSAKWAHDNGYTPSFLSDCIFE